jgi:hypothetical protein
LPGSRRVGFGGDLDIRDLDPGLDALAEAVVVVVGAAAVLGHVETGLLLLGADPDLVEDLEDEEQEAWGFGMLVG